jgi:hypothetical protein
MMLQCSTITPFGWPVDPEVNIIYIRLVTKGTESVLTISCSVIACLLYVLVIEMNSMSFSHVARGVMSIPSRISLLPWTTDKILSSRPGSIFILSGKYTRLALSILRKVIIVSYNHRANTLIIVSRAKPH